MNMPTLAPSPFLSDDEIASICDPLVSPAAQRRYLGSLGLVVNAKPNGRPLVARGEFDRVLIGRQQEAAQKTAAQPNRTALLQTIKGGKRGAQTQGR